MANKYDREAIRQKQEELARLQEEIDQANQQVDLELTEYLMTLGLLTLDQLEVLKSHGKDSVQESVKRAMALYVYSVANGQPEFYDDERSIPYEPAYNVYPGMI